MSDVSGSASESEFLAMAAAVVDSAADAVRAEPDTLIVRKFAGIVLLSRQLGLEHLLDVTSRTCPPFGRAYSWMSQGKAAVRASLTADGPVIGQMIDAMDAGFVALADAIRAILLHRGMLAAPILVYVPIATYAGLELHAFSVSAACVEMIL